MPKHDGQNPQAPQAQHSPEHQEMARAMGLNLGSIDWSRVASFLQFLATLLQGAQPGMQPGATPK